MGFQVQNLGGYSGTGWGLGPTLWAVKLFCVGDLKIAGPQGGAPGHFCTEGLTSPPLVFSTDKQSGYYRKGGNANFRLLLAEW